MSPARPFIIAALLGASLPLWAEEAATETTAPDPAADVPPATGLPAGPTATPSPNVTVNLINRLVQKKILSQDEAAELIKQAEADAAAAQKAAAQADIAAVAPPPTARHPTRWPRHPPTAHRVPYPQAATTPGEAGGSRRVWVRGAKPQITQISQNYSAGGKHENRLGLFLVTVWNRAKSPALLQIRVSRPAPCGRSAAAPHPVIMQCP